MYRCLGCGHLFEDGEQKTYSENVGECHGAPAYMYYSVCPVCGEEYEEVKPCKICEGYETIETGEEFCEGCKKEVKKRYYKLLEEEFDKKEIELLKDLGSSGELEI